MADAPLAPRPLHTEKETALARLLLECRDAISCISMAQARLHSVSLTLADRIDTALEPWKVADDDPRGI